MEINSYRNIQEMENFISKVKEISRENPAFFSLLSYALFRFADWGISAREEKIKTYYLAKEAGEKALTYSPDDLLSRYSYALSCGRIAENQGGLGALDLLHQFETHLLFVLSVDPDYYLASYALGMRYRDAPWPMKDEKKAEIYYRYCIKSAPDFLNAYYDLSVLLLKQKRNTEAVELLQYVIESGTDPDWVEESKFIQESARALLKAQ
jgi:tetratricopeptide (TPR) repeat protein